MNNIRMFAIFFLITALSGCGGLRYSEISPDAANFHPRKIAILPADTAAFPEASGIVDRLFAETLAESRWCTNVVGGEKIAELLKKNAELRMAVSDYLTKRAKVDFSDPELSRHIGALTGTEAFLITRVDSWNYTVEGDKKVAKVGVSITMVEANTGKIMWNAAHNRISNYLVLKPDLADMARGVIREMTDRMPH